MKHLFKVSGYGFDGPIDQFRINESDSINVRKSNLLDKETLLTKNWGFFFFKRYIRKPVHINDIYFPYKHHPSISFINIHNIAQPCNYVKGWYAFKYSTNIHKICRRCVKYMLNYVHFTLQWQTFSVHEMSWMKFQFVGKRKRKKKKRKKRLKYHH